MKKRFWIIFALCIYLFIWSSVQASLFDDIFDPNKTFVVPQVSVDLKKPTSIGSQNLKIIETQFEKIKKKLERFGPIKKKEIYTQASKNITNLVKSRTNKLEKDALNYLNTLVKREINTLTTSQATLNELFWIEEKECIVWYIYKDDECMKETSHSSSSSTNTYYQDNKRNCSVPNGYGYQYWDGSSWWKCNVNECNTGYNISNNTCMRNNYTSCFSSQHWENGYCVANTRYCSISNGTGKQNWNGSDWSTCYVDSCHSGYYISWSYCVRYNYNDSCDRNEHLENGYCVPDSRYCSISNGAGKQNWNGSYWSSCYAYSCHSGYYLSWGSCLRNNDNDSCDRDEHLENGYCVPDTRYCSISNGAGKENWNGNYWSTCYAQSCDSGYYLSWGSCVRNNDNDYCASNEHLENGNCVSNTKNCTITNGVGKQTWLWNYWGQCYVQTCNSWYYIFANACERY